MKSGSDGALAAQVAMNTTLAAATGGITVFLLRYVIMHKYDVGALCNGILAGLVSITAGCGNMECGSAVATGLIGGGPVQQFNRVPGYPQYILILDLLILKPDGSTCNC